MMLRRTVTVLLSSFLAIPPVTGEPASPDGRRTAGVIEGVVRLNDQRLTGVKLAFLEVGSGAVARATSRGDGSFRASVPSGRYVVATEGEAGLVVDRGPILVSVAPGQVASADLGLLAVPVARWRGPSPQRTATPPASAQPPLSSENAASTIEHDAIRCMEAGRYPLVPARIEPANKVSHGRVYFHAAPSQEWYYVEMGPTAAGYVGKLPRPKIEAGPITYYVEGITTEAGSARTPEIEVLVVRDKNKCEGKPAAFGPPGEVTVFSAGTGAVVEPIGFITGGLMGAKGVLLLLAGAATLGILAATHVFNSKPTPPPSAQPTPTPSPQSSPPAPPGSTPSPSPEPTAPPIPGTPFR